MALYYSYFGKKQEIKKYTRTITVVLRQLVLNNKFII